MRDIVICNYNVDLDKLISLKNNPNEMLDYVTNLLPPRYRFNINLISNQRYYCTTLILDSKLPIEEKREIANILLKNIKTVGYLDSFINITEIESLVDVNRLNKLMERKL